MAQGSDRTPATPTEVTIKVCGGEMDQNYVSQVSEPFQAPEILVDGVSSMGLSSSNIKVTLFSERTLLGGGQSERVVVCRLVMNVLTAHAVALTLRSVLDDLVAKGRVPPLPTVNIE